MDKNTLLIVLTENVWLHLGISSLMPEMRCLRMDFNQENININTDYFVKTIIAIDSLILFKGEWLTFKLLQASIPSASVVWLLNNRTGSIFPNQKSNFHAVDQKISIVNLRCAIVNLTRLSTDKYPGENVSTVNLTNIERRLLTFFLDGASVSIISRATGIDSKKVYFHRRRVMEKMGFRQMGFLQLVCTRNKKILGLS